MDSLSIMLDRLRPSHEDFLDRFLQVTSVYNAPFDSDTVLRYLKEGTLRDEYEEDWVVDIPPIQWNKVTNEYVLPTTILLYDGEKETVAPMPETIEEFRAIAKAYGIEVRLNTLTAHLLYA